MSSNPNLYISASNMEMIQTVLDRAGYNAKLLVEDQRLFNTASLLVMKLFLAGEESPLGLTAKLEYQLGKACQNRQLYKSPHERYAIQGLPIGLQTH